MFLKYMPWESEKVRKFTLRNAVLTEFSISLPILGQTNSLTLGMGKISSAATRRCKVPVQGF